MNKANRSMKIIDDVSDEEEVTEMIDPYDLGAED
jgi:hypothetical protein